MRRADMERLRCLRATLPPVQCHAASAAQCQPCKRSTHQLPAAQHAFAFFCFDATHFSTAELDASIVAIVQLDQLLRPPSRASIGSHGAELTRRDQAIRLILLGAAVNADDLREDGNSIAHQMRTDLRGWAADALDQHRAFQGTFLLACSKHRRIAVYKLAGVEHLRAQIGAFVGVHVGAELLFHTDGFGPSAHALSHPDSLELPKHGWGPELNTGLFLMRPSALPLAQAWCAALRSDAAFANWKNDQQSLNELVRRGATLPPSSPYNSSSHAQLISVYEGSLVRVRVRVRP